MSEQVPTTRAAEEQDSDASLLAKLASRDERAMTNLFHRYSRLVYSVALRVLNDSGKAEDVLQEVFMQIWKRPPALPESHGNLGAWLAVITRNRSIDEIRRVKPSVPTDEIPLASPFNLDESSEQRVLIDRVRAIAYGLPPEQQTVLDMAFFEGLTHVEIAAKTGVPLGTVKTRIRAAVTTLGREMHR